MWENKRQDYWKQRRNLRLSTSGPSGCVISSSDRTSFNTAALLALWRAETRKKAARVSVGVRSTSPNTYRKSLLSEWPCKLRSRYHATCIGSLAMKDMIIVSQPKNAIHHNKHFSTQRFFNCEAFPVHRYKAKSWWTSCDYGFELFVLQTVPPSRYPHDAIFPISKWSTYLTCFDLILEELEHCRTCTSACQERHCLRQELIKPLETSLEYVADTYNAVHAYYSLSKLITLSIEWETAELPQVWKPMNCFSWWVEADLRKKGSKSSIRRILLLSMIFWWGPLTTATNSNTSTPPLPAHIIWS